MEISSLTSPIARGNDATLEAQTSPGANCDISVIYKSGPSSAAGLVPKQADGEGDVSWTWRVGGRTTPGDWPIAIRCSVGGDQTTASTEITVLE